MDINIVILFHIITVFIVFLIKNCSIGEQSWGNALQVTQLHNQITFLSN